MCNCNNACRLDNFSIYLLMWINILRQNPWTIQNVIKWARRRCVICRNASSKSTQPRFKILFLSCSCQALIKIWAPTNSLLTNEHPYCYWNKHKGILCSVCCYLNKLSHGHQTFPHQWSKPSAFLESVSP